MVSAIVLEIEKIILTEKQNVVDACTDTSGMAIVGLSDDTITTGSNGDTIVQMRGPTA